MTDQTPRTEAGRRALYNVNNDRGLDAADILAIEAEARAEGLDVAAERVRAMRYNEPQQGMDEEMRQHNQTLDAVLAILAGETER